VTAPPSLPIAQWPDWALAPWRHGDRSLAIPPGMRRALGRYLSSLRQRGSPLDGIG